MEWFAQGLDGCRVRFLPVLRAFFRRTELSGALDRLCSGFSMKIFTIQSFRQTTRLPNPGKLRKKRFEEIRGNFKIGSEKEVKDSPFIVSKVQSLHWAYRAVASLGPAKKRESHDSTENIRS